MADNSDVAMKIIVTVLAAVLLFKIMCNGSSSSKGLVERMTDLSVPTARILDLPESGSQAERVRPPTISDSLLPEHQPADDGFGEFAPNVLEGQNFLDPSAFIGLNTVSGSLRIPNLSIRYLPPNPQEPVSVFNNSTVEPDAYRNKSFDIMD